jgi:hypothetical protein
MGDIYLSPTGKILLEIYEKNKKAALKRTKAENTNLMEIISKTETLLLTYRGQRLYTHIKNIKILKHKFQSLFKQRI